LSLFSNLLDILLQKRGSVNRLSLLTVISFAISISIFLTFVEVSAGPIGENLLDNPGFELGLDLWTTDIGALRSSDPLPHSGLYYLIGGFNNSYSLTTQRVDLLSKGFTVTELDSGLYYVNFGGWQSGWHEQQDSGMIQILFEDSPGSVILQEDLGWFYSNNTWTLKQGSIAIPVDTRYIVFAFHSKRYESNHNDGYLDDAYLKINTVPEPSVTQEVPILTGIWEGVLTATQSNCLDVEYNGDFQGSVTLTIESQDGQNFSGRYTVFFSGVNSGIREEGIVEGTISAEGNIEAAISFQNFFGNLLDTNGKATAQGNLTNDTINLSYNFHDYIDPATGIGDTCSGNGQITVIQNGDTQNPAVPATNTTPISGGGGGGGGCFIRTAR
jgi:hypothetical protein